ncbi:MAG TPA: bifunctional pyr operon transcriptional regulator/uracil phosphoribosyltransferase PyrR [Gammaproteobacteria bacterium]|jgi:pyrimidine operon attenuation protein/uracil phosphoribosyltransferase|nr:bifunctional pyr operon transcriptional regulator/uracil phosphoribosyltransferase PyrR [Gammaproteobacteria bacterium]
MPQTNDIVDINATIAYMADELRPLLIRQPVMIGIHTGGVWVAERLHRLLELPDPLGTLDISFYRDDFTRVGVNPTVKTSNLPVNFEERHVVLVDDVLHTGRTIRAALNEIFDYGRPASVTLAVLLNRDGRELPIEAQIVGHHLKLKKHQHIKLLGPEPLQLEIQEAHD